MAINGVLNFALLRRREQVVRLLMQQLKISEKAAQEVKQRGGIPFDSLEDFAVAGGQALSFVRLRDFNRAEIEAEQRQPYQLIRDCIKDLLLREQPQHTDLVLISEGQVLYRFAHAAVFKRHLPQVFGKHSRAKQLLVLDNHYDREMAYPCLPTQQVRYLDFSFEKYIDRRFENRLKVYNSWRLFGLTRRQVSREEAARLHAKMMWVLTGDQRYTLERMSHKGGEGRQAQMEQEKRKGGQRGKRGRTKASLYQKKRRSRYQKGKISLNSEA
jgi:hypothetical protein